MLFYNFIKNLLQILNNINIVKTVLEKFEDAEIYFVKSLQFDIHSHFVYNSLALTYIEL